MAPQTSVALPSTTSTTTASYYSSPYVSVSSPPSSSSRPPFGSLSYSASPVQQSDDGVWRGERKESIVSPSKPKKRKLIIIPRKPKSTSLSLQSSKPPPPSETSSSSAPYTLSFSSTVAQSWNDSLRNYVQRALKEGKTDEQKRKIDGELRIFIAHAEQSGFLDKNWTTIPLPPSCRDLLEPRGQKEIIKEKEDDDRSVLLLSKRRKTMSPPEPDIPFQRRARWDVPAAPLSSLSSRRDGVLLSLDEIQKLSAAVGKKSSKPSKSSKIKKMGKMGKSVSPFSFPKASSKTAHFGVCDDLQEKHDITNVIVGRSITLERQFLRLTGDPDPNSVRPLRVLRRAFDLVMEKYGTSHDYLYAFEQLKSIRQDIMVCLQRT
jgi:hypothetical protein